MSNKLLFSLFGLTPFLCYADQVPVGEAERVAQQFFGQHPVTVKGQHTGNETLKLVWQGRAKQSRSTAQGMPTYYVFNRGDNKGFVVISGEDAVRPVLAYAYEGSFGTENIPENLKQWMNHVDKEIADVRAQQMEPTAEVKAAWEKMDYAQEKVQLVTPWWNQTKPYNTKCPGYGGWEDWHAYTGCTITATAIVMGYHQWPDRGQGQLKGYTTGGLGVWVEGVNLDEYAYRWDKMPDINGNILPTDENSAEYKDQEDAISTLMRDLGVMARARYDFDGTSAHIDMMEARLPRNMKYNENMFYAQRKYFTDKEWHRLMTHEIDHQRPILYAGYDKTMGHAFVLDGYDANGFFSVNWGWGGMSNGFYSMDALNPYEQGAGGFGSGYSNEAEAVLRITPNRLGDELEPLEYITFTETNYVEKGLHFADPNQLIEQGAEAVVTAGRYCNLGNQSYRGALQLVITNARGDIKKVLHTTPERDLSTGMGTMPLYETGDRVTVTFEDPIAPGDRIRLVYLSQDGTWKPVVTADPNATWEIVLKEGDATPQEVEVTTVEGVNLGAHALATFSADVPTTPSDDAVEVYYAEAKDAQTIVLKKVERAGDRLVVPAHTGVVLSTQRATDFRMLPVTQEAVHIPESNLLRPSTGQGMTVDSSVNAFILGKRDSNVLFYHLSSDDRKIAAHRSYIVLPSTVALSDIKMVFDEVTGIEGVTKDEAEDNVVYDLSGRKVRRVVKGGIYIKNGKKFIVR